MGITVESTEWLRSNWNLEMLVFAEGGKPEYPEKNPRSRDEKPTTNSTHVWRRDRESNPGHIGGKRVLSPLRHPCSHWVHYTNKFEWTNYRLTDFVSGFQRFASLMKWVPLTLYRSTWCTLDNKHHCWRKTMLTEMGKTIQRRKSYRGLYSIHLEITS